MSNPTHRPGILLATAAALLTACGNDTPTESEQLAAEPMAGTFAVTGWSEPVSLGSTISTLFNEQQPTLSKNGLALYFASNRPEAPGDGVLDNNVWVAQRACDDCPWRPPLSLGPLVNTASNDANPTLSRDQHWLFFTTNRTAAGSQGANDLWGSYREHVHDDFGWQAPVNLGSGVNTSVNENAPAYFENGALGLAQLFFNRQAGPPNVASGDIHVSELSADGTWGMASPVSELNSPAADQRPSITHDGLEIYFWSSRAAGRGQPGDGYIWQARRQSVTDTWSPPTLVDDPINAISAVQPFIHSHGRTETLLFVRNLGTVASPNFEIFMSTRTRGAK